MEHPAHGMKLSGGGDFRRVFRSVTWLSMWLVVKKHLLPIIDRILHPYILSHALYSLPSHASRIEERHEAAFSLCLMSSRSSFVVAQHII